LNRRDAHWRSQGQEPDYRFSLANERTFLAWIRTALAILAGGILLHEFALKLQPRWMMPVLSIGLAGMAGLLGAVVYQRWRAVEIAMRQSEPLPRSWLLSLLSGALVVLSGAMAVLLVLH
jgi:putative membrane protein